MEHTRNKNLPPVILVVFLLSYCFWTFLATTSHMLVIHDAIGYEKLGFLLIDQGWASYFSTGPNREPLYPIIIAISVQLSKFFSISHITVLLIIQMMLLAIAQWLLWCVLRALNSRVWIQALVLAYFACSASIINSSLIMYSEIATYPLVLLFVLALYKSWNISEDTKPLNLETILYAAGLGLILAGLCFIKSIFELLTPVILFMCAAIALTHWHQKTLRVKTLSMLCVACISFYIPVLTYKYLNYQHNQQFVITDRGSWALYGNTARRVQPLQWKDYLAALSFSAGIDVCQRFFSDADCQYWTYAPSDELGARKRQDLRRTLSADETNKELIRLSLKEILKNPPQYTILFFIESLKALFWEDPIIKFTAVSPSIANMYQWPPIKILLRWVTAVITWLSMTASLLYLLFKIKSKSNAYGKSDRTRDQILACTLLLIAPFVLLHSFFLILPRYILPIVPLFMIVCAIWLDLLASYLPPKRAKGQVGQT